MRNHTRCDEDVVEQGEEDELLISNCVANLPKTETNKQRGTNVEGELVVNVVDVAVHADVCPVGDNLGLCPEIHRELMAIVRGTRLFTSSVSDDVVEVLVHACRFRRVKPDLMPVFTVRASYHVDHVFRRVGARRARSVVAAKVFFDSSRVVTNVTEVDGLATLCKEQKGIELSEKEGGWLMDSDQDGLANVGELAKESDSIESGLAVQSS